MFTFDQVRRGYLNMWNTADVRPEKIGSTIELAKKIVANKAKYQAVEHKTGVPWFMIGPIHNRESGLSFKGVLHNGDPLGQVTHHVPRGRGPFATWEESAIDALTMTPHKLNEIKDWPIERILYETERYNGFGYMGKINSPYVWSWTNHQQRGKYVADGRFDPNTLDMQAGCAALLKELQELDSDVAARIDSTRRAEPLTS